MCDEIEFIIACLILLIFLFFGLYVIFRATTDKSYCDKAIQEDEIFDDVGLTRCVDIKKDDKTKIN